MAPKLRLGATKSVIDTCQFKFKSPILFAKAKEAIYTAKEAIYRIIANYLYVYLCIHSIENNKLLVSSLNIHERESKGSVSLSIILLLVIIYCVFTWTNMGFNPFYFLYFCTLSHPLPSLSHSILWTIATVCIKAGILIKELKTFSKIQSLIWSAKTVSNCYFIFRAFIGIIQCAIGYLFYYLPLPTDLSHLVFGKMAAFIGRNIVSNIINSLTKVIIFCMVAMFLTLSDFSCTYLRFKKVLVDSQAIDTSYASLQYGLDFLFPFFKIRSASFIIQLLLFSIQLIIMKVKGQVFKKHLLSRQCVKFDIILIYPFAYQLGWVMLVVEAGIDVDVGMLKLIGAHGVVIGVMGSVLPMAFGFCISYLFMSTDMATSISIDACFALLILSELQAMADATPSSGIDGTSAGGANALPISTEIINLYSHFDSIIPTNTNDGENSRESHNKKRDESYMSYIYGDEYLNNDGNNNKLHFEPKLPEIVEENKNKNETSDHETDDCIHNNTHESDVSTQIDAQDVIQNRNEQNQSTSDKLHIKIYPHALQAINSQFPISQSDDANNNQTNIQCIAESYFSAHNFGTKIAAFDTAIVVGFSISAWVEFAFILAAASFAAGTIDQESFNAVLLAASFTISYFEKKAQKRMDDNIRQYEDTNLHRVYFPMNTKAGGQWGRTSKLLHQIFHLDFEIVDFRSLHAAEYNTSHIKPLTKESFYVMDSQLALPPTKHLDTHEKQQLKDRVRSIRNDLRGAFCEHALINIKRWLPSDTEFDDGTLGEYCHTDGGDLGHEVKSLGYGGIGGHDARSDVYDCEGYHEAMI